MQTWEYKTVAVSLGVRLRRIKSGEGTHDDVLNDFGREGWELVNVLTVEREDRDDPDFLGYFKRPVTS